MPLHPTSHYSGEFPELQIELVWSAWRPTQQILIRTRLEISLSRIEAAIETGLNKGVKVRTEFCIEEQRKAGIKKAFVFKEQAGRTLVDIISLQVQQPS